jgi:hypothetical protein
MRTLVVGLLLGAAGATLAQKGSLDAQLDDRIALNKEYKKENVAAAKGSPNAKDLAKYEAGVYDAWVALLEHAKKQEDDQLKTLVLRLEYFEELRGLIYDLEDAKSGAEKKTARDGIQLYERKLSELK